MVVTVQSEPATGETWRALATQVDPLLSRAGKLFSVSSVPPETEHEMKWNVS